jgi:hypothetical protein
MEQPCLSLNAVLNVNVLDGIRDINEQLALIDRIQDELYETGLIRESGEKIEYAGNEILGTKPRTPYALTIMILSHTIF